MSEAPIHPSRYSFVTFKANNADKVGQIRYAERSRRVSRGLGRTQVQVSRPYDGISIKDDTYAVLSVVDSNNKAIPIMSYHRAPDEFVEWDERGTVANKTEEYSEFVLQQVQEARMEKKQIVETFGESFVFFFGEHPRVTQFSGVLMNTEDYNWRSQFWYNYQNYLRGSKLVQLNAKAFIAYDTIVVGGYIFDAQAVDNSESPYSVPFSFSMLVTDYLDYSNVGGVTAADMTYIGDLADEQEVETYPGQTFVGEKSKLSKFILKNNALLDADYRKRFNQNVSAIRNVSMEAIGVLKKGPQAIHNFFNNAGGIVEELGDQVAATQRTFAQLTSKAFPLALNAQNFVRDPTLMVMNVLGVGVSNPSEFTSYGKSTRAKREDTARGIRRAVLTPVAATRGGYVGELAAESFDQTWKNLEDAVSAGTAGAVAIGGTFLQAAYKTAAVVEDDLDSIDYENGHANKDYTEVVARDSTVSQSLKDSYGDTEPSVSNDRRTTYEEEYDPADVSIDQGQSTVVDGIEATYQDDISVYRTRPKELVERLRQAQNDSIVNDDTQVVGIRGVDDDDAEIKPVV